MDEEQEQASTEDAEEQAQQQDPIGHSQRIYDTHVDNGHGRCRVDGARFPCMEQRDASALLVMECRLVLPNAFPPATRARAL